MENKEKTDQFNHITEGPIIKSIISLSIPIIIGNLLQTSYQIIDTFWVGRLGVEAVAAVSLSFPIIFFVVSFSGGIGLAGAIFISQYKGSGNIKKINEISGQTFLMAFFASIIFSIVGYFATPSIIKLFGAEPSVVPDAIIYLKYSFLGLFFVFGYLIFQSIIRAIGDAKTPTYIVFITVILNAVLDPLFIFGFGPIPAFGVSGAAVATLFTQAAALIIGMALLFSGKLGIHLNLKCFKPNFLMMKKIIKLGMPVSFEQSSRSVGFIIMTVLVATFGTITLAAYGIGMRMISLVIIPAISLSIANSTLVGQNIGAGKTDRAEIITKISYGLGFAVLSFIGLLFFIFSKEISALFIPNDLDTIASSSLFLKITAFSFGFIGIQMALFGTLRGAGSTSAIMKIAFGTIAVQLGTAFFLSKYTSLADLGLWISFPVSNIFGSLTALIVFLQGNWKNIKIIEAKPDL